MNKNVFLKRISVSFLLLLIFNSVNTFAVLPNCIVDNNNNYYYPSFIPKYGNKPYGAGKEALKLKKKLGDFDFYHSRAYKAVVNNFGKSVRLNELLVIINSIRQHIIIKHQEIPSPNRNEKRNVPLLIKYIETNYDLIVPYFSFAKLCDKDGKPIPLDLPS